MTGLAPAHALSPARTAAAAAGALAVAIKLLGEAARSGGGAAAAAAEGRRIEAEAAALAPRLPGPLAAGASLDDAHRALGDCAQIAREVAHLAEFLAASDRRPCPLALAAARLADTAAQLVLDEVADETAGHGSVEVLSRRARQLVAIHDIETRLDAAVARLAAQGIKGSGERRAFKHAQAPRLTDADWDA